jgi:hypothetical protein
MKVLFSWVQLTAGHLHHSGPRSRIPPRSSSLCRVEKEALATLPLDGSARGPCSPPLQLQHGRRMLQPRQGFPTDGGATIGNQPPLRAASHSPQRTADASPCSASHRRAQNDIMMKAPHQQADRYHGLARCTASVLACARDGDDLDGGLHFYSRLGQGAGPSSSVRRGPAGAVGAKSPSTPSPLTADRVERMYHQLAEIHAIAAMQLVECAHWRWTDSTPCSI